MSNVIIKVDGLGKLYKLGEISTGTISHDLNRWWARVRGKEDPFAKIGQINDRTQKGNSDYVWALKDISFEVNQGEVLGIIGRNGAGKSTLLKILSKVTTPTTGYVKFKGRIASLLEVGTGFHPELTGRENVFLNGAILGMKKHEIKAKFDEIVDFAGVERYIDTPVKRYSSGMYVRLAFAVAAFLEPEILIIDEVLAVGDIEFQKKCLGRMHDVSHQDGRTVLFVSHNIEAIRGLCNKGILLKNGRLLEGGPIDKVIDLYIQKNENKQEKFVAKNTSKRLYFSDLFLQKDVVDFGEKLLVNFKINSKEPIDDFTIGMSVLNNVDNVVGTNFFYCDFQLKAGDNLLQVEVPANTLIPGEYKFVLAIARGKTFSNEDVVMGYPQFTIQSIASTQDTFSKWSSGWGSHLLKDAKVIM